MQIFKDTERKEQLSDTLDFGELMAGQNKIYTFYVFNDSKTFVKNVKFNIDHPEIEIISAPEQMEAEKSSVLKLKWTPSVTLKKGLSTAINISYIEVWS